MIDIKRKMIVADVIVVALIVCMHDCVEATYDALDVSIESTFPHVVLVPPSSSSSCSYTLTGIFESRAKQAFFDPRVDTDIADTRITLSDITWTITQHHNKSLIALTGVPRAGSTVASKHRFSTIEIIFNLNQDASNGTYYYRTADVKVDIRDYDFIGNTDEDPEDNLVLVLEWKLATGYPLTSDDDVTRNRRRITAGNCVYDAGTNDAIDDRGQGVRCEVRFDKNPGDELVLYQSYALFIGSVTQTGALIGASATPIKEYSTNSAATHLSAHCYYYLTVFVVVLLPLLMKPLTLSHREQGSESPGQPSCNGRQ